MMHCYLVYSLCQVYIRYASFFSVLCSVSVSYSLGDIQLNFTDPWGARSCQLFVRFTWPMLVIIRYREPPIPNLLTDWSCLVLSFAQSGQVLQ